MFTHGTLYYKFNIKSTEFDIKFFFFAILLIINSIISIVFIYLFNRFYISREQKIIIRIFKFLILLNKFIRKL